MVQIYVDQFHLNLLFNPIFPFSYNYFARNLCLFSYSSVLYIEIGLK